MGSAPEAGAPGATRRLGLRLHALLTDPRGGVLALAAGACFLARTDPAGILGAASCVPALGLFARGRAALAQGVRSVRYLALVAIVLHGWWGGGEALWPAAGALSPRTEGLSAGVRQAVILALLAIGARAVLLGASRGHFIAGLHALLAPLRIAGVSPERVALRLWLTLEAAQTLIGTASRGALAQHYRGAALVAVAEAPAPVLPALGAWWRALVAPAAVALALTAAAALVRALGLP